METPIPFRFLCFSHRAQNCAWRGRLDPLVQAGGPQMGHMPYEWRHGGRLSSWLDQVIKVTLLCHCLIFKHIKLFFFLSPSLSSLLPLLHFLSLFLFLFNLCFFFFCKKWGAKQSWLNGHEFQQQGLGVGDGRGSLACCSPWGRKESDTTEQLNWTEWPLKRPVTSRHS